MPRGWLQLVERLDWWSSLAKRPSVVSLFGHRVVVSQCGQGKKKELFEQGLVIVQDRGFTGSPRQSAGSWLTRGSSLRKGLLTKVVKRGTYHGQVTLHTTNSLICDNRNAALSAST